MSIKMSFVIRSVLLLLFVFCWSGICNGAPASVDDFYLGTEKVSRDDAVVLCQERSMELVSIQDSEKNEAIYELLKKHDINYPVWTSGYQSSNGSIWTWLNGGEFKYFNWGPGEPNSARGNESCLEVFKKNTEVLWNDQPCEDKRGFICEKVQNECETELVSVSVNENVCSISASEPNIPAKKFYLSTQKATYAQALKSCSDMFMQLAELRNEEENNALYKVMHGIATTPYWTAGHRNPGGSWEWLNNEPITYFNWRAGEPNSASNVGACLEVFVSDKTLLWNDQICSDERFFVCQKVDPVVQIAVKGKLTLPSGSGNNQQKDCSVVVKNL
nr:macrophage mannose receptor 1-like [Leptinotarsa decemlineata]